MNRALKPLSYSLTLCAALAACAEAPPPMSQQLARLQHQQTHQAQQQRPVAVDPTTTASVQPGTAPTRPTTLPARPRVALILPLSAPGNIGKIAKQYKNAAQLALETHGANFVDLIIKDSQGLPGEAQAAAEAALGEQAEFFLGPLLSASVSAVTPVVRPAGRSMISFSSDENVAAPNVYMVSVTPEQVVDRILNYAIANGHRKIVALVPAGNYGRRLDARIRQTVGASGGVVLGVESYTQSDHSVITAVNAIAASARQADAIFIPAGGKDPAAIAKVLRQENIDLANKKLLGTGQWTSVDFKNPNLRGAWFADIDQSGFGRFKKLYQDKFGETPTVNAGYAYDSMAILINSVKRFGRNGFKPEVLQTSSGFSGSTGKFRLKSSGKAERGLAIYEINNSGAHIIAWPPNFGRTAGL